MTKLNELREQIEKKYFMGENTEDCLEMIRLLKKQLDYLEDKCLKKKKKI